MIKIELKPLDGIIIESIGKISLGQSSSELHELLGQASTTEGDKRMFYDDFELRVDFDNNQKIEFIEFIYGPFTTKAELSIYGVNPFIIGADNLIDVLTLNNNGDTDSGEAPYCYTFPNISVGVWREFTTEDIDPFDTENLAMAKNFWTIGIGVKDYYKI